MKKKKLNKTEVPLFYLLGALTHDDTASLIIKHGSVGLAHHLQDVIYGIVHISKKRREKQRSKVTNTQDVRHEHTFINLNGSLTHGFCRCSTAYP